MRDEWFIRGKIPMTKSEVRAAAISKLELSGDSILWDVGAGTGSVSVEASLLYPGLRVMAFEQKEEGIALIRANAEKGGCTGITAVQGKAPACFPPEGEGKAPTHAFLGGTGGSLDGILEELLRRSPSIRVVISCIALESLSAVLASLKKRDIEPEIVSVSVARAEAAGPYHLMKGLNPVYLISFGGEA